VVCYRAKGRDRIGRASSVFVFVFHIGWEGSIFDRARRH
jgi:hypothetical protein